jgi:putative Ca2+/H+ antiporter (TMEM165/GDT1 family)
MEAFLISITTVAVAEMGDRTQLLALILAARYRRPSPILAGMLIATLANHLLAGLVGSWLGKLLTPGVLDLIVGCGLLAMALWALRPDHLDDKDIATNHSSNAFVATLCAFFLAEIGDKTQIATLALAAAYSNLTAVVAGTTCGMLVANAPVVFLGKLFADRLPMKLLHRGAALLFAALGVLFMARALRGV